MEKIRRIQRDRSGVSAALAIAVVLVLAVAAGAAYYLLAGSDDGEKDERTTMEYDLYLGQEDDANLFMKFEMTFIGESDELYFVKADVTSNGEKYVTYMTDLKQIPGDAVKTGNETIDTIDGKKSLEVWTYTHDGDDYKVYYDPDKKLTYKEITGEGTLLQGIMVLKAYDVKQQDDAYEQSEYVGKTYMYGSGSKIIGIECIADCIGGQYGIEIGGESYFLSDYPQGLPTDAVDSGTTATLNTIHGSKTTQVWNLEDWLNGEWTFYYDEESHIIYKFIYEPRGGTATEYDLAQVP